MLAQSCVSCEFHAGLPIANRCPASYYLFQQTGRRLLVVTRQKDECVRINGAIEVMVLAWKATGYGSPSSVLPAL